MNGDLAITTLAERPELRASLWSMPHTWPAFMEHELVGGDATEWIAAEFPQHVLVATGSEGDLVARALSVPFALGAEGRRELPATGWDRTLRWALTDLRHGRTPDTVSAIDMTVATGAQRRGIAGRMVSALRDNARAGGFKELVAPARPSAKHLEPDTPMTAYAVRARREDGLPHDPWLRVHARAGGAVESVAPASRTVVGSLGQWRRWTGLPFDSEGPVTVPGALVPVLCSLRHEHAVYCEPNVWVRYRL
ncbi:N-acetyltransferase [Streptomyces sp. YIM B13518]|uniref:N-acetyltransferase n=1 Tax=Streptomyces sp. YIM B13518 TaxID=3366316 RepID=UPI00368003AF